MVNWPRVLWRRILWRLDDYRGDAALGVPTRGFQLSDTDTARQFYGYWACPYATLDDIAARMAASDLQPRLFLDIGCGLGRPLYALADRFERLIGYEVDPAKVAKAKALLAKAQAAKLAYRSIEIVEADAVQALELTEPAVLFLYNPFGPEPLRRFAERIVQSRQPIDLYYVNPQHSAVLTGALGQSPERVESFVRFDVWRLRP